MAAAAASMTVTNYYWRRNNNMFCFLHIVLLSGVFLISEALFVGVIVEYSSVPSMGGRCFACWASPA